MIDFLLFIIEKIFFFVPKKCKELDLLLENLDKALNIRFVENDIRRNAKTILNIALSSSEHLNGINEIKKLSIGNYYQKDKEDLKNIVILYEYLYQFEMNNDGKIAKEWDEIEMLLCKLNKQRNVCKEIILRRKRKGLCIYKD